MIIAAFVALYAIGAYMTYAVIRESEDEGFPKKGDPERVIALVLILGWVLFALLDIAANSYQFLVRRVTKRKGPSI